MVWEQTINSVVSGLVSIKVLETGMKAMNMGKRKKRKQKSKSKGKGMVPKNQYY